MAINVDHEKRTPLIQEVVARGSRVRRENRRHLRGSGGRRLAASGSAPQVCRHPTGAPGERAANQSDPVMRAALLVRDERPAAAAAGAYYTDVGAVLGKSQPGASRRLCSYLHGAQPGAEAQQS